MASKIVSFNYKFIKTISGEELLNNWTKIIKKHGWFLDETDDEDQEPFPLEEFIYYVELNQDLTFLLYNKNMFVLSLH